MGLKGVFPGTSTETVTATDEEPEDPHVLFAVTVMFPLAALGIAVIELVVDVPDQPNGNVHV